MCSQSMATGTWPQATLASHKAEASSAQGALCWPTTPSVMTDMAARCASARATAQAARARNGSMGSATPLSVYATATSMPATGACTASREARQASNNGFRIGRTPVSPKPAGQCGGGPNGAPTRRRTGAQRGQTHMRCRSLKHATTGATVNTGPENGNNPKDRPAKDFWARQQRGQPGATATSCAMWHRRPPRPCAACRGGSRPSAPLGRT